MEETRKNYSREFKQKAAELSNLRGNVQEIAPTMALKKWNIHELNAKNLFFYAPPPTKLTDESLSINSLHCHLQLPPQG